MTRRWDREASRGAADRDEEHRERAAAARAAESAGSLATLEQQIVIAWVWQGSGISPGRV